MHPAAPVDVLESSLANVKPIKSFGTCTGQVMQSRRQYPQRKRTRLPAAAYSEPSVICSITISTVNRLPVFVEEGLTPECADLLASLASDLDISLHAYCFMPDHVHLLMSPSPSIPVIEFVRRFKSLSTRLAWDRGRRGLLWQQGFYDRFIRRDEDLRKVIEYIFNNPVRAGLVSEAAAYLFSGPRPAE